MSTISTTLLIPVSSQFGTTALYTIPKNRVGIVKAQVEAAGTFKIDGNVVLISEVIIDTWTVLGSSGLKQVSGDAGALRTATGGTNGSDAFTGATALNRVSTNAQQVYTVTEGQTVQGTGSARYYIELYKLPKSPS